MGLAVVGTRDHEVAGALWRRGRPSRRLIQAMARYGVNYDDYTSR